MLVRALKFEVAPVLALSMAVATTFAPAVQAQVVSDHNLANVRIVESNACAIIRVEFYSRVQLHSYFPHDIADSIRIQLKGVDRSAVTPASPGKSAASGEATKSETTVATRREQLRAPANERAPVNAIELENAGFDQTLSIHFRNAVAFKVGPGRDPRTILIAVAGRKANSACEPVFDEPASPKLADVPMSGGSWGNAALDTDMAEARTAMSKSDPDRAIAYLTRVVEAKPAKLLPEALELLGLAREQKGHVAHAKAEYKAYLHQFPQGEGFARVQQRLAALDRRELAKQPIALPAGSPLAASNLESKVVASAQTPKAAATDASIGNGRAQPSPANPWTIQQWGSLSTFYNLNQGGRDYFTKPKLQQGWEKENINQTYRNSTLSQADYTAEFANAFYQSRVQMSASQEHRFTDNTNELRISSLNLEATLKETKATFKFGRQTHYGGGILGRFDGAIATVPVGDGWKIRAYGGSSVERSSDRPFLFDRYFYGSSLDYQVNKKLDVAAYAIDQKITGIVDRRAIGAEARFVDETRHGFGAMDYDLNFNELNSIIATGTLNFADKSSLTGVLDYRRSPILFASNALQGQVETSLKDLLRRYTMHEIEDLALDRTPKSVVASVAYSRYLRETLQVSGDVTVTNMSSMQASGGVAATPSTGWDTYTMLQLMATDVYRENDSAAGSVRYATTQSANRVLVEGSYRLPALSNDWRIGPMLRLGYATYKLEPQKEYIVHPMLRASYNVSRNLMFELEIGKRWTLRDSIQGRANESDLLLLGGMRYDFHSAPLTTGSILK